jgi:hypothetical protein
MPTAAHADALALNAWAGDVVCLEVAHPWTKMPSVLGWSFVATLLGAALTAVFTDWGSVAPIWIPVLVLGIALGLASAKRRAYTYSATAPIPSSQNDVWRRARALWRDAALRSRRRLEFDVSRWIQDTGPTGPRVIALSECPPPMPPPTDVFEEVDMSASRVIGKSERQAIYYSLLPVSGLVLMAWWASGWLRVIPFTCIAFAVVPQLYRLGVRPLQFGATTASLGRLSKSSAFGSQEATIFDRTNSVLMLNELRMQGRTGVLDVILLRGDGKQHRIAFQSGFEDPAFAQFMTRWSYRDGRAASRAGDPVIRSSSPP